MRKHVELVPATREHAIELAFNMSPADVEEVYASTGYSPGKAMRITIEVSRDPVAALVDGRVACMLGIEIPHTLSRQGAPWLLSTPLMAENWVPAARESYRWLHRERVKYDLLANYVDVRHLKAIKWLRFLGFKILEPAPFGPFGMPFHRFEMPGIR